MEIIIGLVVSTLNRLYLYDSNETINHFLPYGDLFLSIIQIIVMVFSVLTFAFVIEFKFIFIDRIVCHQFIIFIFVLYYCNGPIEEGRTYILNLRIFKIDFYFWKFLFFFTDSSFAYGDRGLYPVSGGNMQEIYGYMGLLANSNFFYCGFSQNSFCMANGEYFIHGCFPVRCLVRASERFGFEY